MSQGRITKVDTKAAASVLKLRVILNSTNWTQWKEEILGVLDLCQLLPYIMGTVQRPDPASHPDETEAWNFNDKFTRCLIRRNIHTSQLIHITRRNTSAAMWMALKSTHEEKGFQTATVMHRALTQLQADDDTNILKHIERLKGYWK